MLGLLCARNDAQGPHPIPLPAYRERGKIRDTTGSYRAFFTLKWRGGVLVFHAFEKRTAKTPLREIEIAAKRLNEMLKAGDTR
jgi:phage-related protein